MRLHEYAEQDGVGLGALVRRREVSPTELRACAREGLERVNAQLNATAEIYEDRLEAGDSEASPDGTFAGVPFMLKDAGATEAGRRYELGSRLFKGFVPRETSNITRLFKAAGLVNLGRTTTPEGALAGTTESVLHGVTRNPWNLQLSTGGSSGGAAALVAAGVLPIAHGNDGAGSIRMPAAMCGLVGLKPSRGRVSMGPAADELGFGSVAEFVLTRSIRDAAAALDAVAVPQVGDPFVLARPEEGWLAGLEGEIGGLRVALAVGTNWRTGERLDLETVDAVAKTGALLTELGCIVDANEPSFDHDAAYAYNAFCFNVNALVFARVARARGLELTDDLVEPVMISALEKLRRLDADQMLRWQGKANPVRRQIGAFFENWDLLVTPSVPASRVPLGVLSCSAFDDVDAFRAANEALQFAFTCPFNVTGQPAISLPLGQTGQQTPLGVQLVARPGDEGLLLRVARALELAAPWSGRRPCVHVANERGEGAR